MVSPWNVLPVLVLFALAPGCHRRHASGEPDALPASAAREDPDQEARALYAVRCVMCHGPDGAGDGPAASVLTPRPRNFHDPAWQAGALDRQIETIIVRGGAGVGRSAAMPPFPTLASRPAVLAAMRRQVRAFGHVADR